MPRPRFDRRTVAVGLLLGSALDQLIPDPRRGHPVAIFGAGAATLERAIYRDSRIAGVGYTAALVGGTGLLGLGQTRSGRLRLMILTAATTWAVLGGRSLTAEAEAVRTRLAGGDLPAARQRLTHLVGRRTDELSAAEISRAVIESVAENTSDAVVAPLFWGAVAGLPGLLAYRAINTLDAMVGHHNARYERFGWASARLDDVANYPPARLTALLTAVLSGRGPTVLATVRQDGRQHPSPNSGLAESAFAAALDIRLGGRNSYGDRIEERPMLNSRSRPAQATDIAAANRLSRRVAMAAAVVCAVPGLLRKKVR